MSGDKVSAFDFRLGRRIAERRKEIGMSQADLAEAVGVTTNAVFKYEKGTMRVSAERLDSVALALGAPIEWFYRGDATRSESLSLEALARLAVPTADDIIRRAEPTPYFNLEGYMERWWLWRSEFCSARVHHILKSDKDRHLHDHPWNYVTVIMKGGYYEITKSGSQWYGEGSVLSRNATDLHRLVVPEGETTWTLFVTGKKIRSWGFETDTGWVHWRDYEKALEFNSPLSHAS